MNIPTNSFKPGKFGRSYNGDFVCGMETIRASYQARHAGQMDDAIESVSAAVEEALIRIQNNPSPDLKGLIEDHLRIPDGNRIHDAVRLTNGRLLIFVSGSHKGYLNRRRRVLQREHPDAFVIKVLVHIGEKLGKVVHKVSNWIRAVWYAINHKSDPDCQRARHKEREKKAKWTTPKNFQPAFC